MKQTLDLIKKILDEGVSRGNRTGIDTIQIPSMDMCFDTRDSIPLLTSRKQKWQNPFIEMKWFISGSQNIQYLVDNGCPFWNEWATTEDTYRPHSLTIYERMEVYSQQPNPEKKKSDLLAMHREMGTQNLHLWFDSEGVIASEPRVAIPKGSVGPMYGYLMRHYPTSKGGSIDQLAYVIENLKTNPLSRRHLVNMWCPEFLPDERFSPQENVKAGLGALAPCHFAFEFIAEPMDHETRVQWGVKNVIGFADAMSQSDAGYVTPEELLAKFEIPEYWLDIKFHMRSNDVGIGFPSNITGYSIFLKMVAQQVNMANRFTFYTGANVHLYVNHLEQIKEWLGRPVSEKRPQLVLLRKPKDINSYELTDFELRDYDPQPHIKFPVAV